MVLDDPRPSTPKIIQPGNLVGWTAEKNPSDPTKKQNFPLLLDMALNQR